MKILVNELPSKPEECIFSREEIERRLIDINTGKLITEYIPYCIIDLKQCVLNYDNECCKLKKV